jgi:hypothetical protein
MHPQSNPAGEPETGDVVAEALTRGLAIAALVAIAVVHVLQLPSAFDETLYLGLLFVLAVAGALGVAVALSRTGDRRAWMAAATLPALILVGFILSRTSGLPDATEDVGEWREPLGLASLAAESLLVGLSGVVLATAGTTVRARRRSAAPRAAHVQLRS